MGRGGRPRKDHGTVLVDGGRLHFTIGVVDPATKRKRWVKVSSGIPVGSTDAERAANWRKAEKLRRDAQNAELAAGERFGTFGASVTLEQLGRHMFQLRQAQGVRTWAKERQRLTDYVFPLIGKVRVVEARPRHLIDAYAAISTTKYRAGKLLSQKTFDETHRTLRMLFEHASTLDLIGVGDNPCDAVGPRYRRSTAKRDPRARARTARSFTLPEVAALIDEPEIPLYWRAVYAVQGLCMTRAGEEGRLTWGDWDPTKENLEAPVGERTLGELWTDGQKTDCPRWIPVHPRAGAVLAEYRLSGYHALFGHHPRPTDLIFPYVQVPGSRKRHGSGLTTKVIWKRLQLDLARLGLITPDQPTRPQHGLRRAGSAAMADGGVSPHDRRCITHVPDLADMQDRYDAPSWQRLSECVLKIKLPRVAPRALPLRVSSGDDGFISGSFREGAEVADAQQESEWRRGESNARPSSGTTAVGGGERSYVRVVPAGADLPPAAGGDLPHTGPKRTKETSAGAEALITAALAAVRVGERARTARYLREALRVIGEGA